MKIINADVKELIQEPGIEGIYKQIERGGRICYKSEDKITNDSAKQFVERMINSQHHTPLEHGTVYLKIPNVYTNSLVSKVNEVSIDSFYFTNKYSRVVVKPINSDNYADYVCGCTTLFITTNYRVIAENNRFSDLKYLCDVPEKEHEKRRSFIITCDRGVSHELVRHRTLSCNQESQRYCNYSKDKYNNEITYIKPCFLSDGSWNYKIWEDACKQAELNYFDLLSQGCKPQEARSVLNNSTKTELLLTGFEKGIDGWEHFIDLRCSEAAHPQAREVAYKIKDLLKEVKEKSINEELGILGE